MPIYVIHRREEGQIRISRTGLCLFENVLSLVFAGCRRGAAKCYGMREKISPPPQLRTLHPSIQPMDTDSTRPWTNERVFFERKARDMHDEVYWFSQICHWVYVICGSNTPVCVQAVVAGGIVVTC